MKGKRIVDIDFRTFTGSVGTTGSLTDVFPSLYPTTNLGILLVGNTYGTTLVTSGKGLAGLPDSAAYDVPEGEMLALIVANSKNKGAPCWRYDPVAQTGFLYRPYQGLVYRKDGPSTYTLVHSPGGFYQFGAIKVQVTGENHTITIYDRDLNVRSVSSFTDSNFTTQGRFGFTTYNADTYSALNYIGQTLQVWDYSANVASPSASILG